MRITRIELFHVTIPLNITFKTAQTTLNRRETIIIKATDELGNEGYGEVVAFNEPFYTEETLPASKQELLTNYIPSLLDKELKHPFDIHKLINTAYPMALAGLENALVDLYAYRQQHSMMELIFNEAVNGEIYSGIVLGDGDISKLIKQISHYLKEGYIRFKVKIKPEDGFIKLRAIRQTYPNLALLADANKSFTSGQIYKLKEFDQLNLLCMEEPLATEDLLAYGELQKELQTPICLDESIRSVNDLERAIQLKALRVLNLKVGRVGGLFYAKQMIELCRKNHIKYWVGSMLESGISKILHVHLASLRDTFIPGDLSASRRYFKRDLIKPEIIVEKGKIKVPQGFGLGVEIDEKALNNYTFDYISIGGD